MIYAQRHRSWKTQCNEQWRQSFLRRQPNLRSRSESRKSNARNLEMITEVTFHSCERGKATMFMHSAWFAPLVVYWAFMSPSQQPTRELAISYRQGLSGDWATLLHELPFFDNDIWLSFLNWILLKVYTLLWKHFMQPASYFYFLPMT